jgi:hypothetical protein
MNRQIAKKIRPCAYYVLYGFLAAGLNEPVRCRIFLWVRVCAPVCNEWGHGWFVAAARSATGRFPR